ncbi:MAG: hypothetical protein ACYSWU_24490 [Planctomycetota bacterium]
MTETFLFRAVPPRRDRSDIGGDAARRHHGRRLETGGSPWVR